MDPIKISEKLISFKSITPKSNGSLEYIKKILVNNNFSCELLKFGNPPVINLFANYKGGAGPRICFAGHTDVVPPGDLANWKFNPFKPKVINGNLYGRGASDMKSAIGAFLSATIEFINFNKNFNGSLCFILTADEEGDAENGTKKVVEWLKSKKIKIDFCIVGEPTNPSKLGEMIKIGRRGSINGTIQVFGKQGHVAYPQLSSNPIDKLVKICNELKKPLDKGSKNFQPSEIVITSVDVNNKVSNLIPSEAFIKFNVRFNNNFSSSRIIKTINNRIKKTGAKYKLITKTSGEAFLNYSEEYTKKVLRIIKKITKIKTSLSTTGGTSDARFISKICPVIEFGIVGKTMHQVNENVATKDIVLLKEIYSKILNEIFYK